MIKKFLFAGMISISALSMFIVSCKKDSDVKKDEITNTTSSRGVYIVCEGQFQTGTGSISFYDVNSKSVTNDLFQVANGRPLGNIAQSMEIYNNNGYIVVNNAGKVEIVELPNMKSKGIITGLKYPRYFKVVNSTIGYVSEWVDFVSKGQVKIINLVTNTIIDSITLGYGPDRMLMYGNYVYVLNSGGYGNDSTVSVINTVNNQIVKTIGVGYNPNSIVVDKNNKMWVLCGGKWKSDWSGLESSGKLVKINLVTNSVERVFDFTSQFSTPSSLTINSGGDMLYFIYDGKVYKMSIDSNDCCNDIFVSKNFYRIEIDRNDNNLYCSDPKDYVSNGWIYRYNTTNNIVVDSFEVGIIPTNFSIK